jgi:hypothetical protein
MRSQR